MHLLCPALQARFPEAGLRLFLPRPLSLLWDCHHGDTFVLKAVGLAVASEEAAAPGPFIVGEITLSPPEETLSRLETFAARHQLSPELWSPPPPELTLPLTLAACHVPERKLFLYSETAGLRVQATPAGNIRWEVEGGFRSRPLSSQETDLVLLLARRPANHLCSFFLAVLRARR